MAEMGDDEVRLRAAFGNGLVNVARTVWRHRHRVADWLVAAAAFPWTAFFGIASPGGVLNPVMNSVLDFGAEGPSLPPWGMAAFFSVFLLVIPSAVSILLLFRRRTTLPLLVVALALLVLLGNPVPAGFALYAHASWYADRKGLAAWALTLSAAFVAAYLTGEGGVLGAFFMLMLCFGLPLVLGLWTGTRRELVGNLRERAERLEREQHLLAERAIGSERTRIAREMHDVVAHRVSMVVLQAGGLEVSAPDDRTAEIAGRIRTTGREALAELREILGVLRGSEDEAGSSAGGAAPAGAADGAAPTAPQPVVADVERIVQEWRRAGMDIGWSVDGRPRRLPAQLERTAYRAVQEALTNAGKYAPGAAVRARIDYGARDLEVVVANGPRPVGPSADPPPGSGHGLLGLRERVALADGQLSAGPDSDGGWQVRVVLPIPGAEEPAGGGAAVPAAGRPAGSPPAPEYPAGSAPGGVEPGGDPAAG